MGAVGAVTSSASTDPDDLERLFRRLVLNVAQLDASRLDGPLPLLEIHQNLVPYRTHRAVLGFDTNQDYEMTLLRLLAGERDLARVEPTEVRDLFAREAQASNPETGIFRRFPSASVRLEPDSVRLVLGAAEAVPAEAAAGTGSAPPTAAARGEVPPGAAPAAPLSATGVVSGYRAEPPALAEPTFGMGEGEPQADAEDESEAQVDLPFSLEEERDEAIEAAGRDISIAGAQCGYCGGELPIGRTVIFCPHCGQNVGVMHCPVCGTELDVGWRYCITCGREMAGLG